MEDQSNKESVSARLVDTHSKRVYSLRDASKNVIVSHGHLSSLDGHDDNESYEPLFIPPKLDGDQYCIRITVQDKGKMAVIHVLSGTCTVNGEKMMHNEKPKQISNGTFLNVGASYQLQYLGPSHASENPKKGRRVLPRTPGKEFTSTPPSKPRRQTSQPTLLDTASASGSMGSMEADRSPMDEGLRSQLKRVAKEITARDSGYKDRKPPPPYEQVGNSIAYQLLHQNHPEVSTPLINSLYPALKAMELKDPTIIDRYNSYLTSYNTSRQDPATPTCMLPADIPTVVFVMDTLLDICSLPPMIALIEKNAPLFCQLMSIFSATRQNQLAMSERRHPSRVLSCMHLGVLGANADFQRDGWIVLANTINTPLVVGKKPTLSEPSITLALSLVESQLDKHGQDLPLVIAILHFLAEVATTAKTCKNPPKKNPDEEDTMAYTKEQAVRILEILKEYNTLRHVMKVPQELRSEKSFDSDYCALVKALVPTRQKRSRTEQSLSTTKENTTAAPSPSKPPRKPQRTHRFRRSGSAYGARELAKKAQNLTSQLRQIPTVTNPARNSVGDFKSLNSDNRMTSDDRMTKSSNYSANDSSTEANHNLINSLASVTHRTISLGDADDDDSEESPLLHSQSCSALLDAQEDEKEDVFPQTVSEPDLTQEPAVASQPSLSEGQDDADGSTPTSGGDEEPISDTQQTTGQDHEPVSTQPTVGQDSNHQPPETELAAGDVKEDEKSTSQDREHDSMHQVVDQDSQPQLPESEEAVCNEDENIEKAEESEEAQSQEDQVSKDLKHTSKNDGALMAKEGSSTDLHLREDESKELVAESKSSQNNDENTLVHTDEPSVAEMNGSSSELVQQPEDSKPISEDSKPNAVDEVLTTGEEVVDKVIENIVQPSKPEKPIANGVADVTETEQKKNLDDNDRTRPQKTLHSEPAEPDHSNSSENVSQIDFMSSPPPISPPPMSGNASLKRDIQSLLDSLRAPLSVEDTEQLVRVPSVSRNSRYYRHSQKRRDWVQQEEPREEDNNPEKEKTDEENENTQAILSPSRMQWGQGTSPSSLAQSENCSPFEVSGQFLSSTHAVLEDITSGHSDMVVTLCGRAELLDSVLELWRNDKGLQAATNTLSGCFSDGSADIPLFTDLLECFMKHQSPWTIAVCVVLLPAIRQLVTTQTDERHLKTVCNALQMIVKRFSDLILKSKSSPKSSRSRLSASVDRHQLEACYRELHATRVVLHNRLDLNFDPPATGDHIRKVHSLLKPYKDSLAT